MGVSHLQQTPTSCWRGSVFSIRSAFFKSSTMAFFACSMVSPLYFPAFLFISPFSLIAIMTGSLCFWVHFTSALSP